MVFTITKHTPTGRTKKYSPPDHSAVLHFHHLKPLFHYFNQFLNYSQPLDKQFSTSHSCLYFWSYCIRINASALGDFDITQQPNTLRCFSTPTPQPVSNANMPSPKASLHLAFDSFSHSSSIYCLLASTSNHSFGISSDP